MHHDPLFGPGMEGFCAVFELPRVRQDTNWDRQYCMTGDDTDEWLIRRTAKYCMTGSSLRC